MIKVIYVLQPTLKFLLRAQIYFFRNKSFPKSVRDEFLKSWSDITLDRMNVKLSVRGKISAKPCLFVGNHLSYMDIPVLCSQAPVVFLTKKEISRWPVIGTAGRVVGAIFVDRSSEKSRKICADKVRTQILKEKDRVVIFPSGTTSIDENVQWRLGAFRIAEENKIPVQAFRISYKPLKQSAFLGKDALLPHMRRLLKSSQIEASVEFLAPKLITNASRDMERIKVWCMKAKL
jgi:1-acyl-sn-glycerol-3-phosphate acyltransferase